MWNPISSEADQVYFASLETAEIKSYASDKKVNFKSIIDLELEIFLSGTLNVERRTRYNAWDLLGDVGGFHDGLFLLMSAIVTTYAGMAF